MTGTLFKPRLLATAILLAGSVGVNAHAQSADADPTLATASPPATNIPSTTPLPPADITGHLGDINTMTALQRQIDILKNQAQVMNLEVQIAQTKNQLSAAVNGGGTVGTVGADSTPAGSGSSVSASGNDDGIALPQVVSMGGVNGQLTANILVPYAGEFDNVKKGDQLPGDMKIVGITSNGVTVSTPNGNILLPEGSTVPAVVPKATKTVKTASTPFTAATPVQGAVGSVATPPAPNLSMPAPPTQDSKAAPPGPTAPSMVK